MSNKWKYYSTMFFWCHTDILHGWFTFLAFFFCIKNRTMHRKYFVLLLEKKRIVCIRFFLIEILCFLNWSIFWKNLKRLKKLSLGHILVAARKLQWVRDIRGCDATQLCVSGGWDDIYAMQSQLRDRQSAVGIEHLTFELETEESKPLTSEIVRRFRRCV